MIEHGPIKYLIYYNPQTEPGMMIARQFDEINKPTLPTEEVMKTFRQHFLIKPAIFPRTTQSTYLSDEITLIKKLIDLLDQPSPSKSEKTTQSVSRTYNSRYYFFNLPESSSMYLRWHDSQLPNIQMRLENDSTRCNMKFPPKF